MTPISDPNYNAAKQARYRERLRYKDAVRDNPGLAYEPAIRSLARACLAMAQSSLNNANPHNYANNEWPDDRAVGVLLRSAMAPATTEIPTWAGTFVNTAIALVANLLPMSAGAELLSRGMQLTFGNYGKIVVPGMAVPNAKFVGQSKPIPVVQGIFQNQAILSPYKFAAIIELTRETIEASNAEELTRNALVESTGPALDAVLLSNNAGVTNESPPGLLYGITPLTPVAGGASAMSTDLATLAGAVASLAGNGGIVFVAAAEQAVAINIQLPKPFPYPLLISTSLPKGTVICAAANAIVSAAEPTPRIDESRYMTVHEDTQPSAIVDIGGVMAYPVRSAFQTDVVGLKLTWPISWALRHPGAIAFMQDVTWG